MIRAFLRLPCRLSDTHTRRRALPTVGTTQLLNFDGQAADGVAPPDTEGSVGLTQYVQWVNLDYNVYDKTTGALILGPVAGNAFWSGFATKACANNNDGDPIVLYDKAASRWFVAQNVFVTPYTQCIAVSNTDDATGTYTRYSFAITPTNEFPDYPKWGVWPNAYFGSYRDFTNGATFAGGVACAIDRNAILAGTAATEQCFPAGINYDVLLPSDLDGLTPPPDGSTNLYVTLGVDTTHIDTFSFHVDFVTPANSTFTGPTHVQVPAYATICQLPFTHTCIPQPTGGEKLDSLGGFMMYRNAYRNFGTYESNVVAHTIAPDTASTAKAAVRWYEIRGGVTNPRTFQSGTREDRSTSATSYCRYAANIIHARVLVADHGARQGRRHRVGIQRIWRLNIKNEGTHRLVRELAKVTGESMTAAVDKAVQERLERVRRNKKGNLAERLLKISRECAPLWKEPYKSMDHGDLLYDEKGLPK